MKFQEDVVREWSEVPGVQGTMDGAVMDGDSYSGASGIVKRSEGGKNNFSS